MNRFLILVYVTFAIFASAYAKAQVTAPAMPAGIVAQDLEATFNQSSFEFTVSGVSPNGCADRVVLPEQKGTLIEFKVLNTLALDVYCTQQLAPFVKAIPVRTVVQVAGLNIDPKVEYTLSVVGSPLTVKVFGSELLSY